MIPEKRETADSIRALLKPLIEQARAEGKWLFCTYQSLWFSPDELQAKNEEGKLLRGPVNWTLRDPQELLAQRKAAMERAQQDYALTERRVEASCWALLMRRQMRKTNATESTGSAP